MEETKMEGYLLLIVLGALLIALCIGDYILERIIIARRKRYAAEIEEDWIVECKKNPSLQ